MPLFLKKPKRPFFSSGPCPKPSQWRFNWLKNALLNRSHRSREGQEKLNHAYQLTRNLLQLPDEFYLFFTPAGGTGAFELALWTLLGPKKIDILAFEHFGQLWAHDIQNELKLEGSSCFASAYGETPNLSMLNPAHDLVLPLTGTASSLTIPLAKLPNRKNESLTFIDGTSALFCETIDWQKCDIFSFSWQKALGSEAAHGSLILSPRAYKRLQTYTPSWPLPKIFRLKENGSINSSYNGGQPINTVSLLCVEDYIQNLKWAMNLGGYDALVKRAYQNSSIIQKFLSKSAWARALVQDPTYQAHSCIAIEIIDENFKQWTTIMQKQFLTKFHKFLASKSIAFDIASYRHAPLGLRLWTGPTIEKEDLIRLCAWLDYGFYFCKK